jgi:hypothetical protein
MLLAYCFSTGNTIMKRALKAMTLVTCAFFTLATVNANRIPRQRLCLGSRDTASQEKKKKEQHQKEKVLQIHISRWDHNMCAAHAIEDVF